MIKALLTAMRASLGALFSGPPAITDGPALPPTAGPWPLYVLSPGKLDMPPPFGDAPPGQMRPREAMDTFPVDKTSAATVRGPYTLGQSPLDGTVSCRLHWKTAGDELEGKKQCLYPRKNQTGDGFEIDYAAKKVDLFLSALPDGAPTLEVEYSYPAIFTLREFRQILVLECYAGTPGEAEKWAGLATAVLMTEARALLDEANKINNRYSAGNYAARSLYNAFHLSEGLLDSTGNSVFRYSLHYSVTGQIVLERTFTGKAEVISKIFSPGHKMDKGEINIEVNLD